MNSALPAIFTNALRASFPWMGRSRSLPMLSGASAALAGLALARLRPAAPVVVVAAGSHELDALHADAQVLAEEGESPLFFPPLDGDAPESDFDLQGFRLNVLRALAAHGDVRPP